jgi:hypothetical protein
MHVASTFCSYVIQSCFWGEKLVLALSNNLKKFTHVFVLLAKANNLKKFAPHATPCPTSHRPNNPHVTKESKNNIYGGDSWYLVDAEKSSPPAGE